MVGKFEIGAVYRCRYTFFYETSRSAGPDSTPVCSSGKPTKSIRCCHGGAYGTSLPHDRLGNGNAERTYCAIVQPGHFGFRVVEGALQHNLGPSLQWRNYAGCFRGKGQKIVNTVHLCKKIDTNWAFGGGGDKFCATPFPLDTPVSIV